MTDTIYALSSGALPAAIGIVRVSGPLADLATLRLAGSLPEPRQAALRRLMDADGILIDEALLLRFPAPRTATGEPLVEFHLHGGRAVVARLLAELSTIEGLREAEPGEFTRRALLNGRLDLTQAEGLADLLQAETEWQRRAAIGSAGGLLRARIDAWRDRVVMLSAHAEAAIDYVEDEDETGVDLESLRAEAALLVTEWDEWLSHPPSEILNKGLRVVLAGPPNSGKSSLFNALLGNDKAIVTPIAGTTRDILDASMDLDGIMLLLLDTAGLRDSEDAVERIGVARAEQAQSEADILLWLGDPIRAPDRPHMILVHARADERGTVPEGSIPASSVTAGGVRQLREALSSEAAALLPPLDRLALNRRQQSSLADAASALRDLPGKDLLIVADSLRRALNQLDILGGRQRTDDVLDALFGRFCLGK